MDIAALSMDMHSAQLQQSVEIAMLKKAMEMQEVSMNSMIENLQQVPSFGHQLDVRA